MTDTNQLPEPELGYIQTDKSNQPAFSARQMREALQARDQVQGEPVAWMHWLNGPVRVLMNKDEAMMELDRLNREYPVDSGDRKMRPLILGDTATPQPAQATQAEVTDEQILSLDCVSIDSDEHGTSFWVDQSTVIQFARAILALRPERVPMTDSVLNERSRIVDMIEGRACRHNGPHLLTLELNQLADVIKSGFGWLEYERYKHHGITAQARRETP